MRAKLILALVPVLVGLTLAQTSAPTQTSATAADSDHSGIDAALKKYIEAYQHKNLQELKAVCPRLEAQGKEYDKIEAEFADSSSGNLKVTLKPLETETMNGQAMVLCERTDEYQTEDKSHENVMGDNNLNAVVSRGQPADAHVKMKTNVRKEKIWIALHREGDNWFISTVSQKKPKM